MLTLSALMSHHPIDLLEETLTTLLKGKMVSYADPGLRVSMVDRVAIDTVKNVVKVFFNTGVMYSVPPSRFFQEVTLITRD